MDDKQAGSETTSLLESPAQAASPTVRARPRVRSPSTVKQSPQAGVGHARASLLNMPKQPACSNGRASRARTSPVSAAPCCALLRLDWDRRQCRALLGLARARVRGTVGGWPVALLPDGAEPYLTFLMETRAALQERHPIAAYLCRLQPGLPMVAAAARPVVRAVSAVHPRIALPVADH